MAPARSRIVSHGMIPRPRTPIGAKDGESPSPTWGQRLAAWKHVPPLVRSVFQTHRGYTVGILTLRSARSRIPLAALWVGNLLIDGVIPAAAAVGAARAPE